jgi:hypothetical protein
MLHGSKIPHDLAVGPLVDFETEGTDQVRGRQTVWLAF